MRSLLRGQANNTLIATSRALIPVDSYKPYIQLLKANDRFRRNFIHPPFPASVANLKNTIVFEPLDTEREILWAKAYLSSYRVEINNFLRIVESYEKELQVCPECLRQDEYCRIEWDLLPFTACPFHKKVLLDKCPRCNKRLSWVRNRASVCRCGLDWRSAVATDASLSELKLSQHILKLFCRPVSEDSGINENNPIYGLEVSDLFRSLGFVADWYLFALTGRRLSTKIENDYVTKHMLMPLMP